MPSTRRRFLGSCGMFGVSAAVAPWLAAGSADAGIWKGGLRLEDLQRSTFEPLLDSALQIADASGTRVQAQLIEVSARGADPRLDQFSLLFRAGKDVLLEQGTYCVEHSALGKQPLFLVPVGRDEKGTLYEVVFCRLIR